MFIWFSNNFIKLSAIWYYFNNRSFPTNKMQRCLYATKMSLSFVLFKTFCYKNWKRKLKIVNIKYCPFFNKARKNILNIDFICTNMTESPKIRNISVRIKRTRCEIADDVRDQVSLKRCTVKLLRYNEEELRKLGKFLGTLEA